jgi:hypothetical protein
MNGCGVWLRFSLTLLGLALLLLPHGAAAPAPARMDGGILVLDDCDPEYKGKAAYEDNLSSISPVGKLLFRISGLNNCESIGSNHMIASDPKRGWFWIIELAGGRIHKYDRTGKELLVLNDIKSSALAVDPDTGDLWVLTRRVSIYGDKTVVFDSKGKQRAVYDLSGFDIAYDGKSKSIWIVGSNLAKVRQGKVIVNKQIATWCASSLAVHTATGMVWVAVRQIPQMLNSKNELLGFDNDGNLRKRIPLDDDAIPFHVSVDSRDGAVWLTLLRQSVRRYTADGKLDAEHELNALAAESDSRSGGVWIVTPEETMLMSRKGDVPFRVKHKGKTSQAWIAGW